MNTTTSRYDPMSLWDFGCWILAVLWGIGVGIGLVVLLANTLLAPSLLYLAYFLIALGGGLYLHTTFEVMESTQREELEYGFLARNWLHRFWFFPLIAAAEVLVIAMGLQCLWSLFG